MVNSACRGQLGFGTSAVVVVVLNKSLCVSSKCILGLQLHLCVLVCGTISGCCCLFRVGDKLKEHGFGVLLLVGLQFGFEMKEKICFQLQKKHLD